jgi:hypothetical protein
VTYPEFWTVTGDSRYLDPDNVYVMADLFLLKIIVASLSCILDSGCQFALASCLCLGADLSVIVLVLLMPD